MSRITNSDTHFRPLVKNGKQALERLGFTLTAEDDQKATFCNSEDTVIDIVYQRFDPPEVWVGNINSTYRVRLDYLTEKYFNNNGEIWNKYSNDQINKTEFYYMIQHFSQLFYKHMKAMRLSPQIVQGAIIEVEAHPNEPIPSRGHMAPHRMHCTLRLLTEANRPYVLERDVWCREHSPDKEMRSSRTYPPVEGF